MVEKNNALIIFIRRPISGKVKTRLAKTLGNEKAVAVYKKLLQHTREITTNIDAKRMLYYADAIDKDDEWNATMYHKELQQGDNLGQRMSSAFHYCFEKGYEKVLIIGSDCYQLTSAIIEEAYEILENSDVVAGPASDGGYYLLGMKTYQPELLELDKWSTDTVLAKTLAHCEKLALEYAMLPVLNDVDEASDIDFEY